MICENTIIELIIIISLLIAWIYCVKKENRYLDNRAKHLQERFLVKSYDEKVEHGLTTKEPGIKVEFDD